MKIITLLKKKIMAQYLIMNQKKYSPQRFAFSCCLGVYIALCPFIGLHTVLVFLCAWIFSLNVALLLAISCTINNPWTMVPIYAVECMIGNWFCNSMHINSIKFDPHWLVACNTWIAHHTGIHGVSLCSFLIGGNLLAIGISGILYTILIRLLLTNKQANQF